MGFFDNILEEATSLPPIGINVVGWGRGEYELLVT